jgi:uncharacterized protein (DUF362 family)
MDRRQFLGTAALAGASLALAKPGRSLAAPGKPDLVAVKNGEPAAMFDRGIEELGGMKAFVKPGQKVLVKPNIGWDVPPERGGNTNPALVARIVEQALAAGAKEVYVFDHSCEDGRRCYKTSGIEAAAQTAGAKVAPAYMEGSYQRVDVANGEELIYAKVHECLLQADVLINVPVLKHHSSSMLTIGMKNLMGVVWDRGFWHSHSLMQCIADMATYRKPALTVVDAYRVMKRNGPRGISESDVVTMKTQLLSTDLVAADAAAAKLFGTEPKDVPFIVKAAQAGLGSMDLAALDIRRITL